MNSIEKKDTNKLPSPPDKDLVSKEIKSREDNTTAELVQEIREVRKNLSLINNAIRVLEKKEQALMKLKEQNNVSSNKISD